MNFAKHLTTKLTAGLLIASTIVTPAFAASGTVNSSSGLNLRSGANTSAAVLTTLKNGTQLEIKGTTADGWYQVTYQDMTGYVFGEYLLVSEDDSEPAVYGKVVDGPLNVRSAPTTSGDKVRQIATGAVVQIIGEENGWYQISDGNYICGDYVKIVDASEIASSSKGEQVAVYAQQFLGCRYVAGGSSPSGFDCSGLTTYVYSHFGVTLNRSSSAQASNGVAVSRSELQPGDILLFSASRNGSVSHVGIYIGGGQLIHASTPTRGVVLDSLNSAYYSSHYVGARRIF